MEKVILEIHQPYSTITQRVVVAAARVIVGRGYHCDVILDDPYVSEEHLEITLLKDGRFLVTDKCSVNGVFVGPKKISDEPVALESGREIKVGRTHIKLLAPRHAVHPTRLHDRLSSLQRFMDRRLVGGILSFLCVLAGVCLYRLTEADSPDYWREDAYGMGAMILFFIGIIWSAAHISLVVFSKKYMPWPRIVSYISVVLLIFIAFTVLAAPYIDFYLLTNGQVTLVAVCLFFVFFAIFEYGFRVICEVPINFAKLALFSALAALLLSDPFSDFGYSPTPIFPETILTADMPLFDVRPLDDFIEQALARNIK